MSSQATRRQVLAGAGRAAILLALPPRLLHAAVGLLTGSLSSAERDTLRAAVARIVPAEGRGDWSAADVGADGYIAGLLSGDGHIYAGGPFRSHFRRFQRLTRVKRIGWTREVRQLRSLYRQGLSELDRLAGGNFAALPGPVQDAILTALDDAGSPFFTALFNNTMEGVYAHPVYGGNAGYRAWQTFAYAGDVHGVRFPRIGPKHAPWNVYGGYAPQEMARPGNGSG